jgi:APA family basic amino acid/polyamine antiporter
VTHRELTIESASPGAAVAAGAAAELSAGAPALRRTIGRFQYFALGFGSIIGSAWMVVLGDWLQMAGVGGAVLAFLAGGVFMCLIAAVYAELCARMPEAGGEFVFAYRLFGERVGFLVGWFVTLFLIAVTAFEAIALAWVLQTLFPQMRGAVLYELLGEPVTTDAVITGVAGVVFITFLNYRDVRLAVTFQSVVTYGFLVVAIAVLAAGAASGDVSNLEPLIGAPAEAAWWMGAFWIFANTAFFLNGFQAIPQAIEERASGISAATIGRVMIGSVALAALFYCAVVLCSSIAAPWQSLAGKPLATAVAVENVLPQGLLARIVLLAAALSLLKTWNAVALMAARILMAQARRSLLPQHFARIHPRYAIPSSAVLFVGLCSLGGLFLGRGAVLPLVNMASICVAFTFVLACVGLAKLRRQSDDGAGPGAAGFRAPGGTTMLVVAGLGAAGMSLIALFEPLTRTGGGVPLEWILMLGWAAIGLAFQLGFRRRASAGNRPSE